MWRRASGVSQSSPLWSELQRRTRRRRLEELATPSLAPYKRPREYRVIADLPKNALGKVLRRELAP